MATLDYVRVFAGCADGGSAAPVVIDADGMSDHDMRTLAAELEYDTGFLLQAPSSSGCAVALRVWNGKRELTFCPQAVIAAVWLLDDLGRLETDAITVSTVAGPIKAVVTERSAIGADVDVLLPVGQVNRLAEVDRVAALSALRVGANDLEHESLQAVRGFETTTLIPMTNEDALHALEPDFERLDAVCSEIGSDGLYAYVSLHPERRNIVARYFPKAPLRFREDVASGSAAVALAFGLLASGGLTATDERVLVHQGLSLYRASEIFTRFHIENGRVDGCWLHGLAERQEPCWYRDYPDE
jgi:PhzF family phenazine biosynthesis protein